LDIFDHLGTYVAEFNILLRMDVKDKEIMEERL